MNDYVKAARYRLFGYSPTDVFNATGSHDDYEAFVEAFADSCRDDYDGSLTYVKTETADSLIIEVSDPEAFDEMIADLNPHIMERVS